MFLIETLAYSSPLRKISPVVKGLSSLIAIILLLSFTSMRIYAICFGAMILVLLIISKIPPKSLYRLLKLPLTFIVLSVIGIAIEINPADSLFSLGFIGFTKTSLLAATTVLLRASASYLFLLFFITSTPINDILIGMKKVRVPIVVIELFMLVYRSIFLFLAETSSIYEAQKLREGYSTFRNGLRSSSHLMHSLVISLFQKQKETDLYLRARGYTGEFYIGGERD